MKMLVCGGRDFRNYDLLKTVLSAFHVTHGLTEIIHGNAQGADRLAGTWADRHNVPKRVFDADWKAHGKAAGPIRNQQMLDEAKPDFVLAFKGGKGTNDMLRRAEAAGIRWERVT